MAVWRLPFRSLSQHCTRGVGCLSRRCNDSSRTHSGNSAHVEAGDVIVIPAGVGHQNLGASPDFHVVGGYPVGQQPDLLRGNPGERPAADDRIATVPLPSKDPIRGARPASRAMEDPG